MTRRIVGLASPGLVRCALASVVLAVVLTLGWGPNGQPVEAAGTTPDLAMAIDVGGGGDDCDTRASTGSIGTTCTVTVGSQFTMRGEVDSIAGLPGTGGYLVFQFRFMYTNPGLTRNDRAGSGEVGPDSLPGVPNFWGLSCSPNTETDPGGNYYVDCWGPGTKSMYLGKLVEVDFTCATAGTRTITMDDASSYIHNDTHGSTPLDKEGNEVLTINCTQPPTPTPTPTPSSVGGIAELPEVDGAPLDAAASSGPNAVVLTSIAAAAAGGIALGGAAWYARRRRLGR